MSRKSNVYDRIIDYLVDNKVISVDDKEIYYYGLEQGALIILNLATVFLIGAILNMFWQSVLFMVSYIPLRIYAGGYHADNRVNCYFFSIIIMIITLIGLREINLMNLSIIFCLSLSTVIIYILAPMESVNKVLKEKEIIAYRNIVRIILLIEVILALFFVVIWEKEIASVILMSILLVSIMLVLGKFKELRISQLNRKKDID